jgi:hypothetical protein
MGSRGSFLESGGFSTPAKWHTIDYVDGIKVIAPKDTSASISLPERSNTPGTSYISFRKNGTFDQLRVFGDDRVPEFDIDYGKHQGKTSLHVHYYENGKRLAVKSDGFLKSGDALYKKYKRLFKGVTL